MIDLGLPFLVLFIGVSFIFVVAFDSPSVRPCGRAVVFTLFGSLVLELSYSQYTFTLGHLSFFNKHKGCSRATPAPGGSRSVGRYSAHIGFVARISTTKEGDAPDPLVDVDVGHHVYWE